MTPVLDDEAVGVAQVNPSTLLSRPERRPNHATDASSLVTVQASGAPMGGSELGDNVVSHRFEILEQWYVAYHENGTT
jgi:hypothetical protein